MMTIEVGDCAASRWMCWRCGGSFSGIMPYTVATRPHSEIEDDSTARVLSAGICRSCAEDQQVQWALPLLYAIGHHRQVYWKLRLRLAWLVLRGKA